MLAALLTMAAAPKTDDLLDYLKTPDASFAFVQREAKGLRQTIDLTSVRALGRVWKHQLLIQRPKNPAPGAKGAILLITGDGPTPGDELDLNLLSNASGLTIAMLFDIPNQPIEGRSEDDLIAETLGRHLADGGKTPPLLFPMTRAAIRAMDAVQAATGIDRFVVAGASKRGWTTWMTGVSGDPRIKGIVPIVYDNLNIGAQMKRQIASWGKYSEMIDDYTDRGLQAKLESPEGRRLSAIIDPYTYLARLKAPVLVVNGTNDRYWTVDSLKAYWPAIKTPKWLLEIPNNPHGINDRARLVSTIGAFARRAFAGSVARPEWTFAQKGDRVSFALKGITAERIDLWAAGAANRDFREARWRRLEVTQGSVGAGVLPTTEPFRAVFAEATVRDGARTFTISSPIEVLPTK